MWVVEVPLGKNDVNTSEDAVHGIGYSAGGCAALSRVLSRLRDDIHGEFDPGSGRTLAACLTHASRTVKPFGVDQWRTGE
jgi:chemotaxis response regulator CheB